MEGRMVLKKKVKKAAKKTIKKTVKKTIKKPAKKPAIKKRVIKKKLTLKKKPSIKKTIKSEGKLIGSITHYFPHVQAAVIKLKGPLAMKDTVKIKGHTTDLTQVITSMQIDRVDITSAKKGDEIGLQVSSRVRQGDKAYKL
jgi:CTP-dependent riboflavin kinase